MAGDHHIREILESVHGLAEMLEDGQPASRRHDLHRLLDQQERLAELRWARLEERVTGHSRLIAALGAALGLVAASLAVLAD